MSPTELATLKALVAAEEARQTAGSVPENSRADSDGAPAKETPMYSWISPRSYRHGRRFKVVFIDIQGNRKSLTLATEVEADAWIADAQKQMVSDGRPVADVVTK